MVCTMMLLRGMVALLIPAACGELSIPTREIAPGVHMPVVSIGTGGLEPELAANITSNWIELGGRGLDTALIYRNQAAIAQTLAREGMSRKDVFITTKVPSCDGVAENVQSDLKQLGTDYIDLLLIHFPDFGGDCAVAWKALEGYFAAGVLKAIGISNFKKNDMQQILKVATVKPHVNQMQLNLFQRDEETLSFSKENGIIVEAYSPIGRNTTTIAHSEQVKALAARYNVSTYQVAMKWILQHGHLLTFQSSSKAHQQEDADLFRFNLTTSEMLVLDELHSASHAVIV
jgi:diketogulonate reductase-like aldo/keto reductase